MPTLAEDLARRRLGKGVELIAECIESMRVNGDPMKSPTAKQLPHKLEFVFSYVPKAPRSDERKGQDDPEA